MSGDMADFSDNTGDIDDDPLFPLGGVLACRCCGKERLHWQYSEEYGQYLLHDGKGLHQCPVSPLREV